MFKSYLCLCSLKINKGQSVFSSEDFSWKLLKNFKESKLQWIVALKNLKHMAQSLQLKVLTLTYEVPHGFTFNIFFIPMASKINKSTFPKCYHFFSFNFGQTRGKCSQMSNHKFKGFKSVFVCFYSKYNRKPRHNKAPPFFSSADQSQILSLWKRSKALLI